MVGHHEGTNRQRFRFWSELWKRPPAVPVKLVGSWAAGKPAALPAPENLLHGLPSGNSGLRLNDTVYGRVSWPAGLNGLRAWASSRSFVTAFKGTKASGPSFLK